MDALLDGQAIGPHRSRAALMKAISRHVPNTRGAAPRLERTTISDLFEQPGPMEDEEDEHPRRIRKPAARRGLVGAFSVHEGEDGALAVYVEQPGCMPPGRLVEMATNMRAVERITGGHHAFHAFDREAAARRLAEERALAAALFNLRPDAREPDWSLFVRLDIERAPDGFVVSALRYDGGREDVTFAGRVDDIRAAAARLTARSGLRRVEAANVSDSCDISF